MRIDRKRPSVCRRYVIAPILVALQVGVAVAAPLSHAYAETLTADRAVETTHSTQCSVIHSDAQCGVSIFKHQYGSAPVTIVVEPVTRLVGPATFLTPRPARTEYPSANGQRAPPTR